MQGIHKQEMMETVARYLPELREKKVIIFGHCNAGEELLSHLEESGVSVHCFLDNNPRKQGSYQGEIPIYATAYLKDFSGTDSIVLIITRYFHTMANQLRGQGYDGTVVEVVEFQSFQAFSTEVSVFSQKVDRVKRGFATLEKMKESGQFLVVCPYRALGDVYWGMSYLPALLEKKKISSCAVAVVGNPCRQVAEMFGHEDVFVLDQKEMDAVLQAIVLTEEPQAVIAHHNHFYIDPSFQILQKKFILFSDYFRDIVYGLPSDTQKSKPTKIQPLSPQIQRQIPEKKSVIMAPYANSVVEAPMTFWETLAQEYEEQGFSVFSNVVDGQAPIPHTTALALPLGEMIAAVQWAGVFVSIRSGLCDVVDSAQCEKILVFPSCPFSTTPFQVDAFFALEGWKPMIYEASEEEKT